MYAYVKRWREKMRDRLMSAFGHSCSICGYSLCRGALELHHLDPTSKDFTISRSKVANWDKLVCEARKCILLCCRCHREFHAGLVEIPRDAKRFNEEYALWPIADRPTNECPICGVQKNIRFSYCSIACSNKSKMKVKWDTVDLRELLKTLSYSEIGRNLGITGNAVKKRAIKLGLI